MNHTPEVRERAHSRPVYVISFVGPVWNSFVFHPPLGRVSSQMATQQESEGAISKGEGSSQEDLRKTELSSSPLVTEALTLY